MENSVKIDDFRKPTYISVARSYQPSLGTIRVEYLHAGTTLRELPDDGFHLAKRNKTKKWDHMVGIRHGNLIWAFYMMGISWEYGGNINGGNLAWAYGGNMLGIFLECNGNMVGT